MHNLVRFYNQNRNKIWLTIIIIASIIIGIRLLNYAFKVYNENNKKDNYNMSMNVSNVSTQDTYSIGTQSKLSESKAEKNSDIIDEFIVACNNKETEKAYNMLSNECKEILYPNIETFLENYYNNVFKNEKTYNKQLWLTSGMKYTYKMSIFNDPLSNGKIEASSTNYDYYTIDNNSKLNISSYVGRSNINTESTYNNVTIKVLYKDQYMDYEEYKIIVDNKSDKTIMIDSKGTTSATYLTNNTGAKYTSYIHELSKYLPNNNHNNVTNENLEEDLEEIDQEQEALAEAENNESSAKVTKSNSVIVLSGTQNEISIKFNKVYNPNVSTSKMVFSDFILDYDEYKTNKTNSSNHISFEISI